VFQHFRKGDEFFCIAGQSTQAVTGMFNLYRASQVVFPGEKILEDAKHFAFNFLREKQAANELFDKWIIMKDLPSEVYIICVPKIKIKTFITFKFVK
jgi:ent-copalyl diphosphate synthase